MSESENEPPPTNKNHYRKWRRWLIAIAVITVITYLPAVDVYIRATSFAPDGPTSILWRQRVGLYNNAPPSVPLFPVERPGSSRNQYCYIDQSGNVIIPGPFVWAMEFSEGLAAVAVKVQGHEQWGFIDNTGAFVIPPQFNQKAGNFREGLANVCSESGAWGYVDSSGQWVVAPQFQSVSAFVGGIAKVDVSPPSHISYAILCGDCNLPPRIRFIDKSGQYLNASDLRDFDVNKAPPVPVYGEYLNSPVEFVNGDGFTVFGKEYESARSFNDGFAAVKENGKWGYIGRSGAFVIPPQFHEAQNFINGYAAVRSQSGGKFGLIDLNGDLVIPAQYNWVTKYRDGLIEVTAEDNGRAYWAMINLDNEQVWPPPRTPIDSTP